MFESISDKLSTVFRTIAGTGKISEENITEALREVRVALLEADVNMKVVRGFVERVKEAAVGTEVVKAVDPSQQFVKIVHDELVDLLGGERDPIQWNQKGPTVIMLCGLQGSGKTSTAGKLAAKLKAETRRPLLVAADVQRPAAIEQLKVLGKQIDVPVHAEIGGDPVQICKQAMEVARLQNSGAVILDTAGRLHVDSDLMDELDRIVAVTQPQEILFVCDAMIGQSAVDTAIEFKRRLALSGAIMTKMDSDARGGAALSLRDVTGVGIKFITVGEKLDALEEFHPDRMAGRILGMGDVVSLVEKAQQVVDEKEAEAMQAKLLKNEFTLEDFRKQLGTMRKMGGFADILKMLPGMGNLVKNINIDETMFKRIEAMIQSMTDEERTHPEIVHIHRRKRIAKGSGTGLKDVDQMLKMFGDMRKMMGKMGKMGMLKAAFSGGAGMEDLMGMMSGGLTGSPGRGLLGGPKRSGTKPPKNKKDKRKKRKKRRK